MMGTEIGRCGGYRRGVFFGRRVSLGWRVQVGRTDRFALGRSNIVVVVGQRDPGSRGRSLKCVGFPPGLAGRSIHSWL